MKKKLFLVVSAGILSIAVCFLMAFEKKPEILINNDKIYEEEYQFLSQVFTGGMKEKEDTDTDRVIYAKIEQQMLKEHKIIEDISYSVFKQNLKEENSRRKQALENGEKIYGSKEYEAKIYYDYIYSEAKEKMIKQILIKQISEEQVQSYAETNERTAELTEEEEQQIRYLLAKEMYINEIKDRVYKAVIQEK